jgi:WW domain-containing oxidoreductase
MARSIPYGARSTADEVLAGVDLSHKRFLVTECQSDIGFETMNALVANGAHVFGLAATLDRARAVCRRAGATATPLACDLTNMDSVTAAAEAIRRLSGQLDAVIAHARSAYRPKLRTCNGLDLEEGCLENHTVRFALVNHLADIVRDGTGRIVIVSDDDGLKGVPVALYARELARRLASRNISVNSSYPGATSCIALNTRVARAPRLLQPIARLLMKSAAQAAATPVLLAASPRVAGITGEYWSDCQIV